MARTLAHLIAAALAALVALPAAASAKLDVRVGIGDQSAAMFDEPLFQAARIKRVRTFVPWNVARDRAALDRVAAYVERARRSGISVLVHVSTDDLRVRRGRLPSAAAYRRQVGRLVRRLRPLGVREWGVWNEANHASQPTWSRPGRAARYYRQMRSLCRGCRIVALDVLDQRGVERYIDRFYRRLPPRLRRRARIVGIHNYSDVNRRRTTGTRAVMRAVRRHVRAPVFWLTETGGVVEHGRSFPCNRRRAANRIAYLFRVLRTYRRQIDRAYVYNWFGTDCRTRMDTGVVNADGSRRPSYMQLRRGLTRFKR
ncbi:MAG: hypothetical protein IRZ32_08385 [Solirubrobacteraceae bacterium]|nr:hypothetical protein [Solirubrobacteraceae bacterium]